MRSFNPPHLPDHLGDALSGLLDGELAADQAQAARSHLGGCPSCAEELLAVGQARTWLRALPPVEAPFGFYERLAPMWPAPAPTRQERRLSPFEARQKPSSFRHQAPPERANLRRRAGLVAVGAAAATAAVLGVGTPRESPVSPSAPQVARAHGNSPSVATDVLSKLAPMGVPVSFRR